MTDTLEVDTLKLHIERLIWLIEVEHKIDGAHITANAKKALGDVEQSAVGRMATLLIGTNKHGYGFRVRHVGHGLWAGEAFATVNGEENTFTLLQFVRPDGSHGMADQRKAILMTGALANDPANGYGGIDEWFIDEEFRGKPEDMRCEVCDEICMGCES